MPRGVARSTAQRRIVNAGWVPGSPFSAGHCSADAVVEDAGRQGREEARPPLLVAGFAVASFGSRGASPRVLCRASGIFHERSVGQHSEGEGRSDVLENGGESLESTVTVLYDQKPR